MPDGEPHGRLPAVMNYADASRYLGISEGRLRNLKWMGLAPPSISYGRRDVRFRVVDLDAWLARKAGQMPESDSGEPARKRRQPRPRKGLTLWEGLLILGAMALAGYLISVLSF